MKIGLITYHSAYNFGSVLQAYATQEAIKSLGHDVEIINYRMQSQKNFYSLFPHGLGIKTYLNYGLALSTLAARKERQAKYEKAIANMFSLSKEFAEPSEAVQFADAYDVYVSGSDQIWNRESQELKDVEWRKYMSPYLLEFTERKKISYASSIAKMTDENLMRIREALLRFDHIAMREGSSAEKIAKLVGNPVSRVLDPTLLLHSDDWNRLIGNWENRYTTGKYIFYYSLKGVRGLNKDIAEVKKLSKKLNLPVVTIAPLAFYLPSKNIINAADACVEDFLGLIKNAEFIITNSYHGTLFSANFNKNFYSLQSRPGSNMRVEEVADLLGFADRVVYDWSSIDLNNQFSYDVVNQRREEQVEKSMEYLKQSISN